MGRKRVKRRLRVVFPNCAGIDIGSREHWVAVDPAVTDESVRSFSSFSDDLEALADWLESLGVIHVAMESTGVYWIPAYEVLDQRGFEVFLVNARATRQVSGRKSDVLDCQWIWELMSHGLLRGAFRPADKVCTLRAAVRQRATKVADQARCVAHMQKALVQMNVQLDQVVSDLTGKTGLTIVRAIVAGERDPGQLAKLRDHRVRASEQTIARSLRGNWRPEHLFALTQALDHYDFLGRQIAECDARIEQSMAALPVLMSDPPIPTKRLKSTNRSAVGQKQLHHALCEVLGVDLTAIPCISVDTALVIAGEIGPDLSRFPTSQHFCSWLTLAPQTCISGGKPLGKPQHKVVNRAGQALKQAASNARTSESFIGASHRARLARMDTCKAVKATAHQLARLIYAMLTQGQPYVEKGIAAHERQRQERQLHALKRKARKMGFALVEAA
jgi:transposase